MPFFIGSHGHGLSGHSTPSTSRPSSRPGSRAPSPTRQPRPSISSNNASTPAVPSALSRENTVEETPVPGRTALPDDPLTDYFAQSNSGGNTPAYTPSVGSSTPFTPSISSNSAFTPHSEMWGTPSGAQTPGGSYFPHSPVEIILDSDVLVMRGQGGDMNPAYLSGRVELNLHESTNIKEINMSLQGKAKIQFSEQSVTGSKSHHFTHNVLNHDWSFLQGDKRHTHTLKAGHHSFPFSLMLNGTIPSTLQTHGSEAVIQYKLKANVLRSGFAKDFHAYRTFNLHRTFTPEALEFNQTLEIENTWPGKIMYSITLPFKAYAAGDDIPVNVKFMPLAKGVRVLSINSVIKEYSLVHTRHSSHSDQRVAAGVKHEIIGGQAVLVHEDKIKAPLHWSSEPNHSIYEATWANLQNEINSASSSRLGSAAPSRPDSPITRTAGSSNRNSGESGSRNVSGGFGNAEAGPSSASQTEDEEDEEIPIGDDEVNTKFSIPIPPWTTPSHVVHPVFITHKIKWSCSISNADGHISELRCALPIVILDKSLIEEARQAGAQTRNLLFGNGTTEDAPQIDLPSYNNHVYDRVAIADSGSNATGSSGYRPLYASNGGRSGHSTPPLHSPHSITPPVSRGPSRPGSPTGHRPGEGGADEVPPRRELSSWADSELLLSLGALRVHSPNGSSPHDTPSTSRAPSRPLSRRGSFTRSGRSSNGASRPGSRASSPDRSHAGGSSGSGGDRPPTERRGSGFHNLLHLPNSLKPMRPLTGGHNAKPILRNSSAAANLNSMGAPEGLQRNSSSFANIQDRLSGNHGSRVAFLGGDGRRHPSRLHGDQQDHQDEVEPEEEDTSDPINRVPSYAIASRGFLGGGVVPLNNGPPTYDDSERLTDRTRSSDALTSLARPRSDTALVEMGHDAIAAEEAASGTAT